MTNCFQNANYSQTKLKEERSNLTVNWKNYGNARCRCHSYYGNGVHYQRNKYILMDVGMQS